MSDWQLSTPVALIIFNRPDATARVFAEIARARPPKLLVVADGPKTGNAVQAEMCRQARAVLDAVDWPCEVVTNYSDSNLGCRQRVSSGLDWVFATVPEAIILEDDCLPDPSFFRYCEDMLNRYREDSRIGMVCGDNFQFGRTIGSASYYFSKYTHIWGWATWARAWRHYDVSASLWPELLASGLFDRIALPCERDSWRRAFDGVYRGEIDTWDFQWTLACWCQSMLAVMPQVNLISNIGFGSQATHTSQPSVYGNLPVSEIKWPLREPNVIAANPEADRATARGMFAVSIGRRLVRRIRRMGFS
jgi:hypothetical protein